MATSFEEISIQPLLWGQAGCIRVPYPTNVAVEFREAFQEFLRTHDTHWKQQRFTGYADEAKKDPDYGLVRKQGYDHKYYWHQVESEAMREIIPARRLFKPEQEFLRVADACYLESRSVVTRVLAKFADAGYPVLLERFLQSTALPSGYNQHVLRGLSYDQGTAGVVHLDRALCTLHLGDVGGYLYHKQGDDRVPIENESGTAIFFFGIKAEVITRGQLRALMHGSEVQEGERRQAEVFFVHGATKNRVDSWRDYVEHPSCYYE